MLPSALEVDQVKLFSAYAKFVQHVSNETTSETTVSVADKRLASALELNLEETLEKLGADVFLKYVHSCPRTCLSDS